MKNLTIALALALSALVFTTPAASATDSRPCVSKVESHGHHHGMSRSDLEKVWEVQHLGRRGTMAALVNPGPRAYVIDYPACGFRDTGLAGISVFYRVDDDTVKYTMRWRETSYSPTGRPKVVLASP